MIDTYLTADSFDALAAYCASFRNVIGPVQGRAASVAEDGSVIPAVGDPAKFYACVRSSKAILLSDVVEVCGVETGVAVCGDWA